MKQKIALGALAIGLFALLASCDMLFVKDIKFGIWDGESDDLSEIRSTFSPSEAMTAVIDFGDPIGTTTLVYTVSKVDGNTVDSWDETIDPEVTDYTYRFWVPDGEIDDPLPAGKYKLTIYKKNNDQKVAQGTFTIQ